MHAVRRFGKFLFIHKLYIFFQPSEDDRSAPNAWYLGKAVMPTSKIVAGSFMTFYVLYTFLVPISIFISMEIVRIIQAMFMVWDLRTKSADGRSMKVHNTNLHEDLGAIQYLLTV